MTNKIGSRFPKVLRIDGLEIPLSFSRKDTDDDECETLKDHSETEKVQEIDGELGHTAAMTALLHKAIYPWLNNFKDRKGTEWFQSLLTKNKNKDTTSEPGYRKINVGLTTEAGQLILKQFRFTPNCNDFDVLDGKAFFDWKTQKMTLEDLSLEWMFPTPTTHFEMSLGIVSIDFVDFSATIHPLSYYLFIPEMETRTYELVPKKVISTKGISVAIIVGKHYEMRRNVLHELFTKGSVCIKPVGVYVED